MPASPTFRLAGRDVSRIGYGAMQLGRDSQPDRDAAVAMARTVADAGISHIDTAEFYPGVNDILREALHPSRDDLLLATKIGAVEDPQTRLRAAQRPEELREQVHANLRSLGAERLGLVYIRRADLPPGIIATGDQIVPLDDQLAELVSLRDAGLIDAIGLSNVGTDHLRQAMPAGIAAVQNAYNLASRDGEPVLDLAAEHGIAWVPYFPLGSAWTPSAGAPEAFRRLQSVTDLPEVIAAAERMGVTPSQLGLAWLLQHRDNVLLIPGTRSPAHLAENLAVADIELPDEVVAALDAVDPQAASDVG